MYNQNKLKLIVGFIIDVSSSMQKNWRNRDGKRLPKIEVIRDALNEQVKRTSLLYGRKDFSDRDVYVFCLGMGFVLEQKFVSVEIEQGKENRDETEKSILRSDIVIDIISLAELLPTREILDELKARLELLWDGYASDILSSIKFKDNIYEEFREYIRDSLLLTASLKLENSLKKRFATRFANSSYTRYEFVNSIVDTLEVWASKKQQEIEKISLDESCRYLENIKNNSRNIFNKNSEGYKLYIDTTINQFCIDQVKIMLDLLSLGYSVNDILEIFDKESAFKLAKKIYKYLEQEVRNSIDIAWKLNYIRLIRSSKAIGAKINTKELKKLTDACVQQYGWSILRPFVEDIVSGMFADHFEEQIKVMMSRWMEISSRREVTRHIKDIATLLPKTSGKSIYSNDFMFGTTPASMAFNRASLRILDIQFPLYQKILVIVSDGEFKEESDDILRKCILLKKYGVIIVVCYVGKRDIMKQLLTQLLPSWPKEAKLLFEIASRIDDDKGLEDRLRKSGVIIPDHAKLFYQINRSQDLEEIVAALIPQK